MASRSFGVWEPASIAADITHTTWRMKEGLLTKASLRSLYWQPSLFLHQVYSQHFIGLATALGQSLIAYLPHLICPSLSFLTLYISVSLLSTVRFLCLIICYPLLVSLSHPQFPVSVYPRFHLSLFLTSINLILLFCTYITTHFQSFRSSRSLPHPNLYKYSSYKLL